MLHLPVPDLYPLKDEGSAVLLCHFPLITRAHLLCREISQSRELYSEELLVAEPPEAAASPIPARFSHFLRPCCCRLLSSPAAISVHFTQSTPLANLPVCAAALQPQLSPQVPFPPPQDSAAPPFPPRAGGCSAASLRREGRALRPPPCFRLALWGGEGGAAGAARPRARCSRGCRGWRWRSRARSRLGALRRR